ncbi:MAG: PASTA domain-containing protein, partial [Streptomycetaceae bacterium]|nr:PASTA domain-containing protein [Streptomycetaceae bacterium]
GKGHAGRRRRGPSRGLIAFLVVVVVAAAIGIVAWRLGAGSSTTMPAVINLSRAEAEKRVKDRDLNVQFTEAFSEVIAADNVIDSNPRPGKSLDKGETVTLTISRGPDRVEVPKLAGLTEDQARQALQAAGLPAPLVEQQDSASDVGQVISSDPAQGDTVKRDQSVTLYVSRGEAVELPSLVGLTENEARDALAEYQITLNVLPDRIFSTDVPNERVAQQTPVEGTRLYPGAVVTVALSKGPELLTVPKVDGKSEGEAKQILEAAGFKVSVNTVFPFGPRNVTSMSPGGGNQAPRGSTVTINVF